MEHIAKKLRRWLAGTCCLLALCIFSISLFAQTATNDKQAILININGAIGPAVMDFVQRGIQKAAERNAQLIILRMDTPGGLGKSMRGIIRSILSSPVPVVTYVAPSGARAASAGTYIIYASPVAAMAPGTNLGAATPVRVGMPGTSPPTPNAKAKKTKDTKAKTTLDRKAIEDASAYLRSLAQLHGRNVKWADKAVREARSISAQEAKRLGVIEIIAEDIPDLLSKLDGRKVIVQGHPRILHTTGLIIEELQPDWRMQFLSVITDPSVAYILMIIGVWGIFFEFAHPGFIVPGVAGTISILVALYAFQLLPINYAGLGLIFLGIAFMVGEAFLPSFGALGIGGVIAFVVGSVMLMDTEVPGYDIALPLIIMVSVVSAAFFLIIIQMALKARFRPIVSGREEMLGSEGEVSIDSEGVQWMNYRGEFWQIKSDQDLQPGQKVTIMEMDGLTLTVKPTTPS